ncbi:terminase small subunit [Rhizobium phage Palo]|jgi:hypothetical protein|uniref:Terminase small subunit n=1 Tax=Rhizobium phage Palo TaxID=2767573 RepID=A0A7L8G5U3_9CAUD|nr:terminase small subunit [Rhizobium phage Palo]
MSKNAADESVLGTLHSKVAAVMVGILTNTTKAIEAYEEATVDASAEEIAALPVPELSPAMLSAMTKFLSDNKITCNVAEDKNLSDLQKHLNEKRRKKTVGNVVPLMPDED